MSNDEIKMAWPEFILASFLEFKRLRLILARLFFYIVCSILHTSIVSTVKEGWGVLGTVKEGWVWLDVVKDG